MKIIQKIYIPARQRPLLGVARALAVRACPAKAAQIKLRSRLTGGVDIKARERSLLSYLTKPITKTLSNAFGER